MVNLYNVSAPFSGTGLSPNLPTNIIGTTSTTFKKLIALFITLFVFMVFTKAGSTGVGALSGVGTFGFFYYANWIPHTQVPWFIVPILALFAFAVAIVERRQI